MKTTIIETYLQVCFLCAGRFPSGIVVLFSRKVGFDL